MTTDKMGFDKPGALARYFAKCWLTERSPKGEQLIAWLLEVALGRNAMYFIEKTQECVDERRGRRKIVPVNAFDRFVITGDPIEDTIIPHAVWVWTCMNDRPWSERVYHRWLDKLLAAGSAEAAYLAASLWPARGLMAKVTYRPAGWLVYRGQLDAEAERLILTEMLREIDGLRPSLYGSFEYDDVRFPEKLPTYYIKRHGFTHPICGLVKLVDLKYDSELQSRIKEALAAPSWSEGVKGAAMLLYLSLKAFKDLSAPLQEVFNTLEQNLFKLDERHINIINFHTEKIEKIDYNLVKDYINYLIILYKYSTKKILSKYMSIGLRSKDILYIGKNIESAIFSLKREEREKVESWLEKQTDDLRIKDIILSIYMSKSNDSTIIEEKLKTEQLEKKIEDIYRNIKYFDKIKLLINQARIYFNQNNNSHKICYFISDMLKRREGIIFNDNFIRDYAMIISSWHPNRNYLPEKGAFLYSKHIGLYLYYGILIEWAKITANFRDKIVSTGQMLFSKDNINKDKKLNLYLRTRERVVKNVCARKTDNTKRKIDLYLNKIESSNLPYEEIRHELIDELIDIMENNYYETLEYLKDENNLEKVRKLILYNIDLFRRKSRNLRLIELSRINIKSQNMIIY
jgi:hypothetical protein